MRYPRFAIIPSNGRDCLRACVDAISSQVDHVTVIGRTVDKFNLTDYIDEKIGVFRVRNQEINISRWWNRGLDYVALRNSLAEEHSPKWDVAILNDDVIVPEGWFDAVSGTMRQMGVAAACSGGYDRVPVLHTQAGPVGLATRMQGFAFIVAGELGLRADERLKWYFTDDYMDWESRKLGGMVMVPGFHVQHLYPNGQMTPEIQAQTAIDAQTFVDIYGMRPW